MFRPLFVPSRPRFAMLAVALLTLPALAPTAPAQAAEPATLTVVHGIPGSDLGLDPELPVDVYVAEADLCLLEDFRFGDVSDRVTLPEGTYTVSVRLPDAGGVPCGGSTVIGPAPIALAAAENATVIAHLTEGFAPTATKYTNDVAPADPGNGRVALHHDAAVGAVDIRLYQFFPWKGYGPVVDLAGVTNPQSAGAEITEGLFLATISPAGGKPVAVEFLYLPAEKTTLIYATGSLVNRTFELLVDEQALDIPAQPVDTALLTVIHGIPGRDLDLDPELPVDVFVSGLGCVLTDFRFGDITGRLPVPAGAYDIAVSLNDADAGACNGPVAIEADGVPFAAGENATVLAHLAEDGSPTASKFVNDLGDPGRGRDARLAVHHAAAAGAVDVGIFRQLRFFFFRYFFEIASLEGVTNGQAASVGSRSGVHVVEIAPAGGHPIFRDRVDVTPGESTQVYAVGSVERGTFQLVVDRLPLD